MMEGSHPILYFSLVQVICLVTENDMGDSIGINRRDLVLAGGALLAASAFSGEAAVDAIDSPASAQASGATATALPSDQIGEVATSAYIYAYPLILMELTRRVATNVADTRQFSRAPMNQFANLPAFPDASFTDVVRPNADTLYSLLWFDVTQEPRLISVPDSAGRYYMLPMYDMWTDVFDSPGKRTTGTSAQLLAIAGPQWEGQLPADATLIHSPTAIGWVVPSPKPTAAACPRQRRPRRHRNRSLLSSGGRESGSDYFRSKGFVKARRR